jgi:hypothetical protein
MFTSVSYLTMSSKTHPIRWVARRCVVQATREAARRLGASARAQNLLVILAITVTSSIGSIGLGTCI